MIKINLFNYYNNEKYKRFFNKIERACVKELNIKEDLELNVVISDNDFIHDYNLKFRGIDKETDVLSFPSDENGELGDIIISYERALAQSAEYGHSLERELGFLLIHGTLHCLGYDHIEKEDELIMFPLQEKILASVDLKREV